MSENAILPVKVSLSEGDFYTLWAPMWKEHGAEWQAFLGDEEHVLLFRSPAELLAHLDETPKHDLSSHPKWKSFAASGDDRVVPDERSHYDLIGVPALLAERPSHVNVSSVARALRLARSLGEVTAATDATVFFASHSVVGNVERGVDHFAAESGLSEWSAIGRAVLTNWRKVIASLDEQVKIAEVDEAAAAAAGERIDAAVAAAEAERLAAAEKRKAETEKADPYDASAWAGAGIDPVRIAIQGKTVYTLRTYLDRHPVFLGKFGEIFTFSSGKTLLRWMVENDDHDLAKVATWEGLVLSANGGELEMEVHKDNSYSFTGLVKDIGAGPNAVDTDQMAAAYELMADAADWAGDDSLNSYFLANPRMQDYISYMLGSPGTSGYVPSEPFSDHAKGWQELEEILTKRFSR
ncbi:hypothetical protein COCCU_02955 [Corynebacterium occultum]|uniref:Primosomal protein n=1 Tax=Corynebacterium occultum TaxID=2675219 RepID=A0A6B8W5D3_9CORY|nr:hypothetical protein [Corynebacterium occultum]QGU06545.1 hypothetical protein COCCU_02955 [Corynebacterium occultum]